MSSNTLSNYAQQSLINALFGKTPANLGSLSSAPTLYVALLTSAPNNASTGATIAEATYTSYARRSTAASDWNAATGTSPTTISNANAILFPACTGGTNTITHFALLDSSTIGAGNVICWGALSASLAVANLITPTFPGGSPGTLTITID